MVFSHKIIDDTDQWLCRETDGVEGIPGSNNDAGSLGMSAVDDVMILY